MIYLKIILILFIFYLVRGVVLSILAKLLGFVLELPNLICAIILHIKSNGFFKVIHRYQMDSAIQTDIYLHYDFRALWRVCFSKWGLNEGYKFGTNKDETLSSALGRKAQEKTLNWIGWLMYIILYIIDIPNWFKGGHCKGAYYSYINKNK